MRYAMYGSVFSLDLFKSEQPENAMKSDAEMIPNSDRSSPAKDGGYGVRGLSAPMPARLPNGATLFIRPEIIDRSGNVGLLDLDFSQVRESLAGFAAVIREGFKDAQPSKTSVELSLELGLSSGKLAAILASGSATASIKIILEWESADMR